MDDFDNLKSTPRVAGELARRSGSKLPGYTAEFQTGPLPAIGVFLPILADPTRLE